MAVSTDRFSKVDCADGLVHVGAHIAPSVRLRYRVGGRPLLEDLTRGWIDRLGILPEALVELHNIAGIHSPEWPQCHNLSILPCRDGTRRAQAGLRGP